MAARHGDTLCFAVPPVIASSAAVGGKKESEGPLAACFDELNPDNLLGQTSWERAETKLLVRAARLCLKKPIPPKSRSALPLPETCRRSVPHRITPCGSWGSRLRGYSVRAVRWRRRWVLAHVCAVRG